MKLNKEEFIKRSMKGEKFKFEGYIYHYDPTKIEPFRWEYHALNDAWENLDGENEFTLVKHKQKMMSVAQYRVYSGGGWFIPDALYTTLDECKKQMYMDSYKGHHEVPGTRVELPDYIDEVADDR